MSRFIWQVLANIVALFLAVNFVPGVAYDGRWQTLVLLGLILGILNGLILPILKFVSAPLIWLSLGIFSLILNLLMLWAAIALVPSFQISNLLAAVIVLILLAIINALFGTSSKKA